ncbi:hypothetical protein CCMSSC00406_0009550 [Pleurotus cornucopiae]|uniref:Uncharacterized protein n=1 Tax=Pleurotus cornucopiae TaxID=5321 RepID=A0ACB7IPW0_PLECO|nr:hypothetical protein CCMSSC00406_0009550 [Pleurotus cornucopiae]
MDPIGASHPPIDVTHPPMDPVGASPSCQPHPSADGIHRCVTPSHRRPLSADGSHRRVTPSYRRHPSTDGSRRCISQLSTSPIRRRIPSVHLPAVDLTHLPTDPIGATSWTPSIEPVDPSFPSELPNPLSPSSSSTPRDDGPAPTIVAKVDKEPLQPISTFGSSARRMSAHTCVEMLYHVPGLVPPVASLSPRRLHARHLGEGGARQRESGLIIRSQPLQSPPAMQPASSGLCKYVYAHKSLALTAIVPPVVALSPSPVQPSIRSHRNAADVVFDVPICARVIPPRSFLCEPQLWARAPRGVDPRWRGDEWRVEGARETKWERERNEGRGHKRGHERTGNAGRGRRARTIDANDPVHRAPRPSISQRDGFEPAAGTGVCIEGVCGCWLRRRKKKDGGTKRGTRTRTKDERGNKDGNGSGNGNETQNRDLPPLRTHIHIHIHAPAAPVPALKLRARLRGMSLRLHTLWQQVAAAAAG